MHDRSNNLGPCKDYVSLYYLIRLFNCISYITSNGRMIVNDELERMWKKATVIYFQVGLAFSVGD
jgi:hypothetical protein